MLNPHSMRRVVVLNPDRSMEALPGLDAQAERIKNQLTTGMRAGTDSSPASLMAGRPSSCRPLFIPCLSG